MMSVKRVVALLPFIIASMLLTGAIALAMTPAKACAADEVITYELNDSYGDGWNGCKIEVVDTADNSVVAMLTIDSGNHAEGTVPLIRGHVYQFSWKKGSYPSECSFTFRSGETTILERAQGSLNADEILLTYAAGVGTYTSYNLWVANTRVDNVNAADVLGDGTVSYDAETHTLTLDNCVCVRDGGDNASSAPIYADDADNPLIINLKGNSVLKGGPSDQYGIYTRAGMTITGDGSLTVTGGGSAESTTPSFGVYSVGAITLDGSFSGTVVAKGAATSGNTYGISCGPNVTVNGGTLIAIGGVGAGDDSKSTGLHAGVSLNVTGGAVIAQGGAVTKGNSIGVNLGDNGTINVSGGTFLVQGGNTTNTSGHSRGIYCDNGGQVTFSGGASVVRAGAVGTSNTRFSSANRSLFGNCSRSSSGMSTKVVGYSLTNRFADGSSPLFTVRRETGFFCVPSSWNNLSDTTSSSLGDSITLNNDSYFINTTTSSPLAGLSSLDTNEYEIILVNLFEGDPDDLAAGLVLSNSGDVSLTGDGSVVAVGGLTTYDPSFGLHVAGNLTVAGPTVIGVSGQSGSNNNYDVSDGVCCASGSLAVSSGKVIGVGSSPNNSANESHGVNVNQDIAASGTSCVVGVGGITLSSNTCGIKAQGITTQDSASVLGAGGSVSGAGANSFGINASSVEVVGGVIAGAGGDRAAGSCGVNSGSVQVHRGVRLDAIGGAQATDHSYGISGPTDGCILEGDAAIAGATSAVGSSDGALQLDDTGLAFGYTDFAGTAGEAAIDSGAALSELSGYKHIKVDTPPIPLASGTCGTCYWEITPDKVLMVYPGELAPAVDGTMPWIPDSESTWAISDIERVVIVSRGEAKVVAPSDSEHLLSQLSYAQSMDLTGLDTSQAQDLGHMFASSSALETLDVSMLDTSKATAAQSMFQGCTKLGSLDLSTLDMTKVADASGMLSGCTALTSLSLPASGMAGVTDASGMFAGCTALQSIDISAAGMTSVTNASGMFASCTALQSLDLSAFDMTGVTDAEAMLSNCASLESLKLGSACKLAANAGLPEAPTAHPYTGKWTRSEGGDPLTAAELMSTYDGSTMAGTYVWGQIVQRTPDELNQLIATATTTSPYKDVDSVQVSADGTDVYTVDMWVTPEAKDALVSTIAAAQQVAANEEATQEQRDTAYYALEAAMAGYVPQRGTKEKGIVEVTTWSQLYEQLQDNGSSIKLTADVKFGTGGGEHESDALVVPAGFISKLDLNGHIVDRGLGEATEAVEGGSVITVAGELAITDSQPTAVHSPAVTFADPLDAEKTYTVAGGIITGGFAVSQYESDSGRYFGGGGVLVKNNAHLVMAGGSVCKNHATAGDSESGGGGVAVMPGGVLDMSGTAVICGNLSDNCGGGVFMSEAVLNMDGNASICFNTADYHGGGVYALRCDATMKGDSSINGNKAHSFGGGAYFYYSSALVMEDNAEIASNHTDYHGGGVAMYSFIATDMTITMKDKSRIYANSCGDDGGGVFLGTDEVVLNMSDESSISANHANSQGGGVYANGGILNMHGGEISGNSSAGSGGGVCLGNLNGGSTLHMTGGTITDNSTQGSGGGVFAESNARAFTLEGTVVIDGNEIVDSDGKHVSENNLHGAAGSGSSMATPITVTGALGEGSSIGIAQWGVPGEDLPVDAVVGFAENNPGLEPAAVFTSDTVDYLVVVGADGEPKLALPEGMGVWIGGKRVTVLNAADVFGDGKVSYDQATKTLTLNGYSFDGYGDETHRAALATTVENLTVNLVGNNKIVESGYYNWYYGTDCYGIWAANGLSFTGSGALEAWAYYMNTDETTGAGIYVASGSLNVGEGFTGSLWAHANRGIGAYAAGDVFLGGGQVKFSGEARAVEAAGVSLGKEQAAFGSESADAEDGVVLAANEDADPLDITELVGATNKALWIEPLECYDLWVNGERLSSVKLTVACGEGTAVFDPDAETPTLTLTNATITGYTAGSAANACICSGLPNLVIKTMGTNLIRPAESGIDGVFTADGCNVTVAGDADEPGSLKLENVDYGFNVGGTINIAGNVETVSASGGANVSDSAITLAPGWGYTKGTSLTQSGDVVIGEVVTVTFSSNGYGGVIATLQVPKGKSINDAVAAMSDADQVALEAKLFAEVSVGGKRYLPFNYYTDPEYAILANFDRKLFGDTTLYAKWAECVTVVDITVEPPVCGTTTETERDEYGNLVYYHQTNKPDAAVTNPNCSFFDYVGEDALADRFVCWLDATVAKVLEDGDSLPFEGEFVGGSTYTLFGWLEARDGHCFSQDVIVRVNGVEGALMPVFGREFNTIAFAGTVTAAHDLAEEPTAPEAPATCTDGGVAAYWTCASCGMMFSDMAGTKEIDEPATIDPLGHKWGKVTYKWSDDLSSCTAARTCTREGCTEKETETVKTTKTTHDATCEASGSITYTAKFENTAFAMQAKVETIPALGHKWGAWTVVKAATAESEGLERRACTNDAKHFEERTIPKLKPEPAPEPEPEPQPEPEPGPEPDPTPVGPATWTRLAGDNAFATMSAVISAGSFEKGGTVVLASLEGYWDALTAAGIAGLEKAPVVMSLPEGLSPEAAAQLKALAPEKIVVCGGTYWLPDALLAEAKAAAGTSPEVVRLAGGNAAQTAGQIAAYGKGRWSDTAIVATAGTFQDALAAAPVSYAKGMPIFLAQFDFATETGFITKETIASMKDAGIKRAYIAGGTYWLPKAVSDDIEKAGIKVLDQLGGASAVETSGLIAELACGTYGMNADKMGVANVAQHYDALASAAFCGQNNSVLVLVSDTNRSVVDSFVKPNASKIAQGYIFGGTSSVSDASMATLQSATK